MSNTTTETAPVGTEDPQAGDRTDPAGTPPVDPVVNAGDASGTEEPETFSREYVQQLRTENAAARVRATHGDEAITRLRELAIESAVSAILMSPDDLSWSDDLADDSGFPDHDKILAAAEALIARKPHLARPRGDVGQGQRSDALPPVSLSGLLRAGA